MPPTRRWMLGALALTAASGCSSALGRPRSGSRPSGNTAAVPGQRFSYGPDDSQWAELHRAAGPSRATVVVIHGGFWRAQYTADLGTPLAADLAARGWTACNIEYRRVGNGGGWPATLDDVGAAIDRLAELDVDTQRLVAIGHSAGGQLAGWAAHREAPKVRLTGVISQAGVLDLTGAADRGVGGSAVPDFLGGSPAQVPDRYLAASPQLQLPLDVPVRCLHAHADTNVPYWQSENYVTAATARGADATLTTVPGDHFSLIDPTSPAWRAAVGALTELTA